VNLCGTCKHWGNVSDAEEMFRSCQAVKHSPGRDIDNDRIDYILIDDDGPQSDYEIAAVKEWHSNREKKAHACDGSDYNAALRCREDFGCILHEPKAEETNGTLQDV
jgi:hypothetical protein